MAEMEDLSFQISADTSNLDRAAESVEDFGNSVEDSMDRSSDSSRRFSRNIGSTETSVNSSANNMSRTFKSLSKTIASALAIREVVNFSKSCIELGSNLAEVQNVVDTVFGSMSGEIDNFAKNTVSQFGLSETMAKKFAGTFGAMGNSMGLTSKEALKMSEALTGLSGDVASFYNISQDEAYTKLKSIYTGETESLKELGVVMTEDNLKAYALTQGITANYNAMSQAEKVSLRYGYVTQALASAQGDFARTSGSWANQTRLLSLQFDSMKANLGQAFISALTPVIRMLNTLMAYLVKATSYVQMFFQTLFGTGSSSSGGGGSGFAGVTQGISDAMSTGASCARDIANSTKKAEKSSQKIKKNLLGLASIDKINNMANNSDSDGGGSSSPSTSGVGGVGGVGGGNIGTLDITDNASPKIENVSKLAQKLKSDLKNWFSTLPKLNFDVDWNLVKNNIIDGLKGIWNALGNITHMVLTIAINIVNDLKIDRLIEKSSKLFKSFGNLTDKITKALCPAFINFYNKGISPVVKWIGEKLADALDFVSDLLDDWAEWFEDNSKNIADFGASLGQTVGVLWRFIEPLADTVWEIAKRTIKGLSDVLQGFGAWVLSNGDLVSSVIFGMATALVAYKTALGISALIDALKNGTIALTIAQKASAVAQGALNLVMSANPIALVIALIAGLVAGFVMLWNKSESFRKFWENLWKSIEVACSAAIKTIVLIFTACWATIKKVWSVSTSFFKGIWNAIKNTFSVAKSVLGGFFSKAWNAIKTAFSPAIAYFRLIWNTIKGIFSVVKSVLSGDFRGAWNGIKGIWNGAKGYFKGIWNGIKDVFSGVKDWFGKIFGGAYDVITGIFGKIVGSVKAPINSIVDLWNNTMGNIRIDIPDWVPAMGGKNFGFPRLPRMATGGVVDQATIAMIGEAGSEAVVPLKNNTEWTNVVADLISNSMKDSGNTNSKNGKLDIEVTIKDQLSGKKIVKKLKDYETQTGNKLLFSNC